MNSLLDAHTLWRHSTGNSQMSATATALLNDSSNELFLYEGLPFSNPNHRDPFDRMIIAKAIRNKLSVVGIDSPFDSYPIVRLW